MSEPVTEWEFTADVKQWIQQVLDRDPSLPFSEAKCEQRGPDSAKRRDLTLLDKARRVVLTGEIKLPFRDDGGSPYNEPLVQDARAKAARAKCDFFFTWNVNDFVLWRTFAAKTPRTRRQYRSWEVTRVYAEEQLDIEPTRHAIQAWLARFLGEFAQIVRGEAAVGLKPPDEQFVEALESALKMPIILTIEALWSRCAQPHVKREVDAWMLSLGWTISDEPEDIEQLRENAARFACYTVVNKLVFHEALRKRYGAQIDPLTVPDYMDAGEALSDHLSGCFARAIQATRDYETAFGLYPSSIGNRIPFYSDYAVPHWRALIDQIHEFDFSKLDYEVIGSIFERFFAPERRRRYGQFYTRVEVVDLINSFCIRTGAEKVMDPACGGGTFLVRAYARKKELALRRSHRELLSELFGVDVSSFATHLTTINLTTRDLVAEENYPQVARSDFFDIEPTRPLVLLPMPRAGRATSPGHGPAQSREVWIPHLDAVVGNPPYIRQERIRRSKKTKEGEVTPGTKEFYLARAASQCADLSGRSDIHCYFWPHAAGFLKDDGYLAFITSSQWLDVEYGFRLQEWMLRNFEIVAIFESVDEPWFVGARVATAVTVLRRQKDEAKRAANVVRFIQLRKPIREVLAHDGTTEGALEAADAFRDEILSLAQDAVNDRYRARRVPQADLWREGVRLGTLMGKEVGRYYGGKWGIYLRAPDLWFEFLDRYGGRLAPLADVAKVHRGITSGKDCFFFPKDCSAECLAGLRSPVEFQATYGVPRKQVQKGEVTLVRCAEGLGEVRPIEAEFLQPVVYSITDAQKFLIVGSQCEKRVLLINRSRAALAGTHALRYIEWGETREYPRARAPESQGDTPREWYDVTGHEPGSVLWPCAHQYKHIAPANPQRLICNQRLFDISCAGRDERVLAGLLNSSLVVLSKFQFGRPVGVEGKLGTAVVDVRMMIVPDPGQGSGNARGRVAKAFGAMKRRKALAFLSERRLRETAYRAAGKESELARFSDLCELDMPDRRELDDAVLEMLGETDPDRRREWIDRLYGYLREFFEQVRQKEEKAIENKKRAKRRGPAPPSEIAAQVYKEIKDTEPYLLQRYDPGFLDATKPFDTYELPAEGRPRQENRLFSGVVFEKGKKTLAVVQTKHRAQDALIALVAQSGVRGFVRVPHEEAECRRVHTRYSELVGRREARLRELIQLRTTDEEMQARIYDILVPMLERGVGQEMAEGRA